jgi:hypothetical protein
MATAPRYKESSFPVDYRAAEVGQIMACPGRIIHPFYS